MTNSTLCKLTGILLLLGLFSLALSLVGCIAEPEASKKSTVATTVVEQSDNEGPPPMSDLSPRDVRHLTIFEFPGGSASGQTSFTSEETLERGLFGAGASPAHLVVVGTPVSHSTRCAWHPIVRTMNDREEVIRTWLHLGDADLPTPEQLETAFDGYVDQMAPQFQDAMRANFRHLAHGGVFTDGPGLACFADFTVNEYVVGDGSNQITVAYGNLAKTRSYELYKKAHAAGEFEGPLLNAHQWDDHNMATLARIEADIRAAIERRKSVVFLAPFGAHGSAAIEAWQAIAKWDVQVIDGETRAVRYGARSTDPDASIPLETLKERITTAAASDAHAGLRIANISELPIYYRDMGAYGNIAPDDMPAIVFSPAQPPPVSAAPAPTWPPPEMASPTGESLRGSVWLTWPASADAAVSGYRILRRVAGGAEPFRALVEDTGNTTTAFLDDRDVKLGRRYVYRIAAVNQMGTGPASVRVAVRTDPLPSPQNLTANMADDAVTLRWTREGWDEVDDASVTGFRILRRAAGVSDFTELGSVEAGVTEWADDITLTPGDHYIYRVQTLSDEVLGPAAVVAVERPA